MDDIESNPGFQAHQQLEGQVEQYKNFMENSKLHIWALNDGVRFFVRCAVNADDKKDNWPRMWAEGESRIVHCAIFIQNEDTTFDLVALWARSETDGSTRIYALEAHREGAQLVLEITGGGEGGAAGANQLVDPNCYDAFMCTAGDIVVDKFHCPALEKASPVEGGSAVPGSSA